MRLGPSQLCAAKVERSTETRNLQSPLSKGTLGKQRIACLALFANT